MCPWTTQSRGCIGHTAAAAGFSLQRCQWCLLVARLHAATTAGAGRGVSGRRTAGGEEEPTGPSPSSSSMLSPAAPLLTSRDQDSSHSSADIEELNSCSWHQTDSSWISLIPGGLRPSGRLSTAGWWKIGSASREAGCSQREGTTERRESARRLDAPSAAIWRARFGSFCSRPSLARKEHRCSTMGAVTS